MRNYAFICFPLLCDHKFCLSTVHYISYIRLLHQLDLAQFRSEKEVCFTLLVQKVMPLLSELSKKMFHADRMQYPIPVNVRVFKKPKQTYNQPQLRN